MQQETEEERGGQGRALANHETDLEEKARVLPRVVGRTV